MADDEGVLGNLPRSRPGQRSEKRSEKVKARPQRTAAKAAARAERTGSKAAARPPARDERPAARNERPAARDGDPVGDAIRTVTGVAATGARVASGVAREVLRRLPRP
jgi:hypothetical protein